MRNSSEVWCETADISIGEIERRASLEVQAGNFPTLVFISLDLLAELSKPSNYASTYNPGGMPTSPLIGVVTSAGHLNIQSVRRLRNFLLVGRKEDFQAMQANGFAPEFWNDEEKERITKAFEDLVILEGDE